MANCPQTNDKTIESKVIAYNSTPLPCTNVATCNDLNAILLKFDNVVCSITDSVNALTEHITNLTEEVMLITEDIDNINNQIFICCPICDFTGVANEITTTTTTTIAPTTEYFYVTTCDSYYWDVTGLTYTDSDEYSFVDGSITYVLFLTICSGPGEQIYTETISHTSPYIWPKNGQTYTVSGSYSVVAGPCIEGSCTYYLDLTII